MQVSLWRESGHSYSLWEAESTRQVLVRLGGRHGRVYSYPADKVGEMTEPDRRGGHEQITHEPQAFCVVTVSLAETDNNRRDTMFCKTVPSFAR